MPYAFIGLPMHFGADALGLTFGVDELKRVLSLEDRDTIDKIPVVNGHENFEFKDMKYINSIASNCTVLAGKVNEAVRGGSIPVTIGGDHSVSMGSVSGVAKEMEVGILWVDAHADSNTPETTITGNIHGMPLAALQGYGHRDLVNIFYEGPKVKTEHIVVFGVRSVDYREKLFCEKLGMKLIYFDEIEEAGFEAKFREAVDYLAARVDQIHLSLDLDVIDPAILPGVSIPVERGLTPQQVEHIFNHYVDSGSLSSLDIVEYNPAFDEGNRTRDFVLKLLRRCQENN